MFDRIKHMLIKEFIQMFRDPRMKAVIFVVPIVQTLVFGYAVTTDVKNIALAVYDLDRTQSSREFVETFTASGYYNVEEYLENDDEVEQLLNQGRVQAVLHVDEGFENTIKAGKTAKAQLMIDGTDANNAGIILTYSSRIVDCCAHKAVLGRPNIAPRVEMQTRAWFNENLESRNFFLPGILASLVMLMTLTLTSMAIVREKEIGTMEQLIVTPILPIELILGKAVPFIIIGFIDLIVITGVAVIWFEVPIRGNFTLLSFATGLYLLTTLGIGLLVSTISYTQQQAMMSAFLIYLPALLLSGFMFPIASMPETIQWITYFNPLRYFLIIVRAVFLKGVGIEILWPQMAALGIIGVLTLGLASSRFQKTLE